MRAPLALAAVTAAIFAFAPTTHATAQGLGDAVSGHVGDFGGRAFGGAVSDRSRDTDAGRGNGDEAAEGGHGSSDPGVGNTGGSGANRGGG